jgi:arabinofuranan 3-O-arabinosyltransferase
MRYLDALEARVSDGRGSPALAAALARAGIGYVLLRRDVEARGTTTPPPERVEAALRQSQGLTLVESFDDDAGASRIDLYRVESRVETVDLTPADEVLEVTGGPEDVVNLLEGGVIEPDRPSLLVPTAASDVDAVGDGYQLRERQFGRTLDAVGPLLAPGDPYRLRRVVHDYAGPDGVERVTAGSRSGARMSASSSSGYPDTVGPVRPEFGPAAVVDGSEATFWRSAPLADSQGQWIEFALPAPRRVEHLDVMAGVDGLSGLPVRSIRVTAGGQSVDQDIDPLSGFARVRLSGAPVSAIRVTVTAVGAGSTSGVVALREVTVPGLDAQQEAVMPGSGLAPTTDVHFRADSGRRACTGAGVSLRCDIELATVGDESTGMRRLFRTIATGSWSVSGTVVAIPSPATLELLDPLGEAARLRASSTLGNDPLVAPAFAHDMDPATWWSSAAGDRTPTLTMRWGPERVVSGIAVRLAHTTTRVPTTAVVKIGGVVQRIELNGSRTVPLKPVPGKELTISFPPDETPSGASTIPLAIAELEVQGVRDLAHRPERGSSTGAPCGLGPPLSLDGRKVDTEVRGTIADVLNGTVLKVLPCSVLGPVPSGEHRLSVLSTDRFAVASMTMRTGSSGTPPVSERDFSVDKWEDSHRVVTVGSGTDSVLRVAENVNPGWEAMLNGRPLEPLVLDGWQQGYVVPSGQGGRIDLRFTPDRTYRAGLLFGAGLALLLVLATLAAMRPGRGHPESGPSQPRWAHLEDRGAVRLALITGAALAGGVPLAGGALAGTLMGSRERARLVIAAAALAGAGALSAASLSTGNGPSSGAADLLAGLGLGLMVGSLPATTRTAAPEVEAP